MNAYMFMGVRMGGQGEEFFSLEFGHILLKVLRPIILVFSYEWLLNKSR